MDKEIIDKRELTEDDIKKILKELKERPYMFEREAKYILFINCNNRPSQSYIEMEEFNIVYGNADVVELEHVYHYPTTNMRKYAVIPKTVPTIALFRHYDDLHGDPNKYCLICVFNGKEWVSVKVDNLP